MGDVRTVPAIGATIAYPELTTVGDIDDAIVSLTFTSGELDVVDLTRSGIYDAVPYFMERFGDAYTIPVHDFARDVLEEKEPPITIDDGLEALRVGVAVTRARESGTAVTVRGVV